MKGVFLSQNKENLNAYLLFFRMESPRKNRWNCKDEDGNFQEQVSECSKGLV